MKARPLNLGLFDLGLIYNENEQTVIINSLTEAKRAETLGYSRYWIGEHLSSDIAWKSTEIMTSLIAGYTSSIRVGTAGVLTYYHEEFWISKNYSMLTDVFGDRIDLGLAKGLSNDENIHSLLSGGKICNNSTFIQKAKSIQSDILSRTKGGASPELWILGSSLSNLEFAFKNDINFSLSLCHTDLNPSVQEELSKYLLSKRAVLKKTFKSNILVNIVCAATKKKAEKIVKNRVHHNLGLSFYGDPLSCRDYLLNLQNEFAVDEIIITNLCHLQNEKTRSNTLIAAIMNLNKN